MLAPVGIVISKADDRESWNQLKRQARKRKKKPKDPAHPLANKKGDHIDLTA